MSPPLNQMTELEALIRGGDFSKVTKLIAKLNVKKIPRTDAVRLANIANRSDQSRLAMRLLYPIIHSEQEAIAPPNDHERIEYAEALRRSGLINEAREILQQVDLRKNPLAHLHLSFCFFNEWRYNQAIPHLRQLVNLTKHEDYLHTIANVNLAAALVHEEDHIEALPLLQEIQEQTKSKGQMLLLGNSLEMTAQIFMRQENWLAAEQTLNQAEELLGRDHNKYLFYVHKWRAIVNSLKTGIVQNDLSKIREQARERQDWESERDCDLHIAVINKDVELLQRVYFGTPHASFRRRVLKLSEHIFSIPKDFLWTNGQKPQRIFDIVKASCDDGTAALEIGSLPHQMLTLLTADFYRPISIGSAFNSLFARERFGQQGSANRVSQLVMRLRKKFATENLDIEISENKGKYSLALSKNCGIRVVSVVPKISREDLSWLKLKTQLSSNTFSRKDLELASSFSSAKAKRLLNWALKNRQIKSIGYGPNTKYELAA